MKINLDEGLLKFLSIAKVSSKEILALQSDASKRKYYRSTLKKNNFLIMDSSYEKNSLKSFVKISNWLTKKGYSAPNIFHKEFSKGFCLLEDFGDTKYSNLKNNNIKERYELTIQLLKSLSKKKPPHFLNNYSSTGPGVVTGGNVKIGECSHVGIGSTVLQKIHIKAQKYYLS